MSFISTRTRRPKHKAADVVDALRDENKRYLAQVVGARDYIALLEQDLAEAKAQRAEAERVAVCLEDAVQRVTSERDDARTLLAPYLAADANAGAVTVPPAVRDTTAFEDRATAPIKVDTLWAALNVVGPVIATSGSTDPTAIPAA